jgi:Transposase family tnp2
VHYACCPKCRCTYRPFSASDPRFPRTCMHRETEEGSRCGQVLVDEKDGTQIPLSRFSYQPLTSWLARLLLRPGLEDLMEQTTLSLSKPQPSRWTDIWHAVGFRNFMGPDKKKSFMPAPPGETRLVFSLFVDWFNPYGNKAAGKKASVGAIYMVCMNLPIALRYRIENVYLVGIIPGPHEPTLDQMNHFFQPLVKDLLQFWNPGVFFSKTHKHPFGSLVRCAVIPVICDAPALRKTFGFTSMTSKFFCNFCLLNQDNICDFRYWSWPRRTWKEHTIAAYEWLTAPTQVKRNQELNTNHVRWTEFLALPYWDPTQFLVVDAMHNLFLNDLATHCRSIWGMDVLTSSNSSKCKMQPHAPEEQAKQLKAGKEAIQKGSFNALMKLRRGYIVCFARVNGLSIGQKENKRVYVDGLLHWV